MVPALLAVILVCAMWVYMDARALDWTGTKYETSTPRWWGLMTALVWIVYFPWYLAARRHAARRASP